MAPPLKKNNPCKGKLPLTVCFWLIFSTLLTSLAHAEADHLKYSSDVTLSRITSESSAGYGYKLEYYVSAPIEAFWRFKTDFSSDILLTSKELIEHRIVKTSGNAVITENRYASAPGLRFLWETTVIADRYRLEFELLNTEDCRHEFHYGSIQLTPAGENTKVTQVAYFDFTGASFWVKYPWYGGMKYTLTKVAKWEQAMASRYKSRYIVASSK